MRITNKMVIGLSGLLVLANFIAYIMGLPGIKYILGVSIFGLTLINAHALLQGLNKGEIRKNMGNLLLIIVVHICFYFLLRFIVNQNYIAEVSKLNMAAKDILAFAESSAILLQMVCLFLSWNRLVIYRSIFTEFQS